ncbi:hypothetical protein EX30DRAFT_343751 [Ascodesmis nigricans]|uniref:Uncharacterized protein n=1 Tax=Ascodesmis nigricans TaxID=341454 RepID=A0A4S2MLH7_9PEZI|nr:hypothetical protein EX30DRAFT_343751 [Ascodesmis nigricans]
MRKVKDVRWGGMGAVRLRGMAVAAGAEVAENGNGVGEEENAGSGEMGENTNAGENENTGAEIGEKGNSGEMGEDHIGNGELNEKNIADAEICQTDTRNLEETARSEEVDNNENVTGELDGLDPNVEGIVQNEYDAGEMMEVASNPDVDVDDKDTVGDKQSTCDYDEEIGDNQPTTGPATETDPD